MKAPGKVDRYLRGKGFGYAERYYLMPAPQPPLSFGVMFARHTRGLLIHAGTYYPLDASGFLVSPDEMSILHADGTWSAQPDASNSKAYWDPKDTQVLLDAAAAVLEWLQRLTDPEVVLPIYDYLLAEQEMPPYAQLQDPLIERKRTPNRLLRKAAYLNCSGRFREASELILMINQKLRGPPDEKVLSDAMAERIAVPDSAVDYLRSIGARV